MEDKESTVSGSPGGYSATESPPVSGGGMVPLPPPQQVVMNMSAVEGSFGGAAPPTPAADCGSVDLLGKKKRGRPRKYDADGNLRLTYSAAAAPPPGFALSPSSPPSEYSSKRGRGKHSGSGNWQILASLGELFASTAGGDFMPHMVTVNTGEDVAEKILSFSQKGLRGVCVLSANGTVSNVAIRQPCSYGGILTYEGRFEILSLSGSFTVLDTGGIRSRTGGLSVSLAGPDGRVVGGGIAGVLTAASPIQIVVGSFMPNGYKVHKRKYNRAENATMASVRSSGPDTATAARPISQAKPDVDEPILAPPFPLPKQNHIETGNGNRDKQMPSTTSCASACWNGSEYKSDQRPTPSPDINISVPFQ